MILDSINSFRKIFKHLINKKSIVSPPKRKTETQAIIMNGISNNPILLLFCVIFCVYAYTFRDPMLSHHVCISLLIHSISIIMSQLFLFLWAYTYSYERIKSILYPPSFSFLNKNFYSFGKNIKEMKFFMIHEGIIRLYKTWKLKIWIILKHFNGFSSLKIIKKCWPRGLVFKIISWIIF